MRATLQHTAVVLGAAVLALAAGPLSAQELESPADGLVIHWRSPGVSQMSTGTWSIAPADGQTVTVRMQAKSLFDRIESEGTTYRVLFPLRNVDPFGMVYEFTFDRAEIDRLGRLDDGKTMRFSAKA